MTRDEVLAMTDEELRIRVAGLLGATDIYRGYTSGVLTAYWPENDDGRGEGWADIPDYPNDIAAAWELRAEMIARGWVISIYSSFVVLQEATLEFSLGVPAVTFFPFDERVIEGKALWELRGEPGEEAKLLTCAFILAMTQEAK
jgi:hypothetical protein